MTSLDPIRPDIAQAWNDLTDSTGLKLERAHLPEYLGEGETVTSLTGATYQDTTGLLVLTGRRLFFFARSKRHGSFTEIPWEPGAPVSWSTGWLFGRLNLTISGSTWDFQILNKKDGERFVAALRSHTFSEPAVSPPHWYAGPTSSPVAPDSPTGQEEPPEADEPPPTSPIEIVAAIERLADLHERGTLTEAEFVTAKTGLLAQFSAGRPAD